MTDPRVEKIARSRTRRGMAPDDAPWNDGFADPAAAGTPKDSAE